MRRLVAVAVLAVLAGCGGDSSSGPAGLGNKPTVAAIADKLRAAGIPCNGLEIRNEVIIVREEGGCDTTNDERITISTFNDNDGRDVANKMASSFGAILVVGNRWTVSVDNDATAKRVQEALGGELA